MFGLSTDIDRQPTRVVHNSRLAPVISRIIDRGELYEFDGQTFADEMSSDGLSMVQAGATTLAELQSLGRIHVPSPPDQPVTIKEFLDMSMGQQQLST